MFSFKMKFEDYRKQFFDTTDRCVQKNLRHFANYVKKVAKNSIKPAKRHSKAMQKTFKWRTFNGKSEVYSRPGQPPLSKMGLLKNNIWAAWDSRTKSAVVGPSKLNRSSNAPYVLEHGDWTLAVRGKGANRRVESVYIAKRPYMWPALLKSQGEFKKIFKDSLVAHSFSFAA